MNRLVYKLAASNEELNAAFEVRRKVFVEEQGISEHEEWDGHDEEALHIVVKDGEKIVSTARVLVLNESQAKLERMAVLKPFRSKGVGREIVAFVSEILRERKVNQIVLHAQYQVVDFYKSCGFEETGSPFWEAGIKHIKMQKRI